MINIDILGFKISDSIKDWDISYDDMIKLGLHYDTSVMSINNTYWKCFYIFYKKDDPNEYISFAEISKSHMDRNAEIELLYIKSKYRSRGYGQSILTILTEELFRLGFFKIKISTDETNTRARNLFSKFFGNEIIVPKEVFKYGKFIDRYHYYMFNPEMMKMIKEKENDD